MCALVVGEKCSNNLYLPLCSQIKRTHRPSLTLDRVRYCTKHVPFLAQVPLSESAKAVVLLAIIPDLAWPSRAHMMMMRPCVMSSRARARGHHFQPEIACSQALVVFVRGEHRLVRQIQATQCASAPRPSRAGEPLRAHARTLVNPRHIPVIPV